MQPSARRPAADTSAGGKSAVPPAAPSEHPAGSLPQSWLLQRTGPPLTVGRIWRRGREILREEGLRSLWFLVLSDLGYRRFLLLERWLDEPIPEIEPRVSLAFSRLRPDELDEYLRFHDEAPRSQLEERLARGDECFIARHEGRIVATSWASFGQHLIRSIRYRYEIGPSEAYLHDSFTDPTFRGRSIAPALSVYVLEQLRSAGLTRVTVATLPENSANLRARAKSGFRVCGRLTSLQLGRRIWHWHRETPSRRGAAPW